MQPLDWAVLALVQIGIVAYGVWRSRGSQNMQAYLLGDRNMKWFTIGLSIMATQASAITFLSTPGQAFGDGMRFVQFYFGLPIAMVVLSVAAVPLYHKLNVYTAYEFLEKRFDLKTRALGALLFLSQRSLAAGLSIYAPSIILSTVLGWDIYLTNVLIGCIVIFYTVSGGTKAVSYTQKQQMFVILLGMVTAAVLLVQGLPEQVSFDEAVAVAGEMGKLNAIDFSFDWQDRYNIWSGLIAGLFLFLSYFGTDQSQVQRYLGGQSIAESRMGLLLNGMIKIPMQFLILFVGALLFVFYQFAPTAPTHFNSTEREAALQNEKLGAELRTIEENFQENHEEKQQYLFSWLEARRAGKPTEELAEGLHAAHDQEEALRTQALRVVHGHSPTGELSEDAQKDLEKAKSKDLDYVFISFVVNNLPTGIVGLLIAVILSAAMSSASSELNALATTTVVDVYKRILKPTGTDKHYLFASRALTFGWGVFAILFSLFASKLENLIQAVNMIGSLVYGTVLGIFLVAFYIKWIRGHAVFVAALLAELIVIATSIWGSVGYLWYNAIGCLAVVGFAILLNPFLGKKV